MASNNKTIGIVVALTVCAVVAYIVYRKFPKQRVSNGTPASGGAIGGGGTDPYYDTNQPQQGLDLAGLINGLASLFKKGSASAPLGGGGGGGLLKGTNLNAYNVLYNAQHGLNQDGTPISYGSAGTTDTLATSINAQIPLLPEDGTIDLSNINQPLNPISDLSTSTDSAAIAFDPSIPLESTSSPAGDAFTTWWDNFTGNPVNQPDTLPDQSISSGDASSYQSAPDYTNSDFSNVGYSGDSIGDYSYAPDYSYAGDSYSSSDSTDYSSPDYSTYYDNSGSGSYDSSGDGYDPYAGGYDNFG